MTKKLEIIPYVPPELEGRTLLSSPKLAKFAIPQWIKDQPGKIKVAPGQKLKGDPYHKNRSNDLTVKRCMPVFDALSHDFVVVTNFDVGVIRNPDKSQQIYPLPNNENKISPAFADEIQGHPRIQFDHLQVPEEFTQVGAPKWIFRYGLKVPKGYSIIFHHPHNRVDLPFYTLSGMVDIDRYNSPVNFPFLLKKDFVGIIPKGTPVVQFSIVKRDSWESVNKDFDLQRCLDHDEEFMHSLDNHYKKHYRESRTIKPS